MSKTKSTALAVPTATSITNDLMKEAGVSNTINQSDLVEYATEKLRMALTQQLNQQKKTIKELEEQKAASLKSFTEHILTHFKTKLTKPQQKKFQLAKDALNKRVTDKTVNKEDKTVEHETWFTEVRYLITEDLTCLSSSYYTKQEGTIQFRYNQKLSPLNKHTAETEDLEDLQDELSATDGLVISSASSKDWTWTIPMGFLKETLPLTEQTAYTDLLARIKEETKLHNRINSRLSNIGNEKAKLKTRLIGAFLKGSDAGAEIKATLDAMVPTVDESLEENLLGSGSEVIDAQQ